MLDTGSFTPLHLVLHARPHWQQPPAPPRALERKHAALLAWLWLEGPTPRSRLAGLLWPEVPEERARGNLRQRLLKLRQEAGDIVVVDAAGLLSLGPGVRVAPPDPPAAPLLQNLEFDDCEAFARWLESQRERERERRKREWLAEVREAVSSGPGLRLDDALYAADQLLQTDRESEEAYRVLMEVYYLRGDHAGALSAWDRCREMLRQTYGVAPSAVTRQLGETILAASAAAQASLQAQSLWQPTPPGGRQIPATVLRPPQRVGGNQAWSALCEGSAQGQVVCVAGSAGLGKSRLLADWAAASGPVAWAAARPGDAVLPYASLSRLLLAALERFQAPLDSAHAAQAARVLPRLASTAGLQVEPVRTDHERRQCLLALARLLADCVARGARAFVLDDLQFADSASIAALRLLAEPAAQALAADREAKGWGLRLVFGLRPEEASDGIEALAAGLRANGRWRRIDLEPLSAPEAAQLLASLGVPALDAARWAQPLWQQVGGNPAFLLESVKLLLSSDTLPAPGELPLPASIEAVIGRRIELLSPRARHLAQLAAIAGNGYGIALAAAALACPPIELSEPLRELELRQIFDGRQFVHDLIASVTLAAVPAAVADFMHRFVAEHLQQHGGEPAEVGVHWQACGEWRLAGRAFVQAAAAAGAAALANEQAGLLDRAIAAFERAPEAHDELFAAIESRANVFESTGHEGLRPAFVRRLRELARSQAQQLSVLNHHNGWLANLAQPVQEEALQAGIPRALAVGRPDLAWLLARTLASHWGMNNRAAEGLALLAQQEAWVEGQPDLGIRALYRITCSSIHAFGDHLPEAIEQARLALQAAAAAGDWPNALPAMSNLGVMHYWRGEYSAAHEVLAQARAQRERLYGSSGSGIKIDIHLGAVLYELGRPDEARAMLQGALAEMQRWPDNDYRRTECLLAENHLAQMFIALAMGEEAMALLACDAPGVADRYRGRRLALRLRWQRLKGCVDPSLVAELQALHLRVASPFNRCLMALELSRQSAPQQALAELQAWFDSPCARQRPGLQLHIAALAAQAAAACSEHLAAARWLAQARSLQAQCAPFDMHPQELVRLLAQAAVDSA
jgi:DNA-binding SARP family transcriptional activator